MDDERCPICRGPAIVDPENGRLTCMTGHYSVGGRPATPEERAATIRMHEAIRVLRDVANSMPTGGPGEGQMSLPHPAQLPEIRRRREAVAHQIEEDLIGQPEPDWANHELQPELRLLVAMEECGEAVAEVQRLAGP